MATRTHHIAVAAVCLMSLWGACAAAASPQLNYPNRPVRVIVPFSPGGGSDVVARTLAPRLSDRLGQPVVVDNRPAGAGIVGTDIAAKAPPDGHTLLVAQAAHASNAQLFTRLPYDPIRDFAPISLVISSPSGMTIHASVPAKTVKEFIAYAKANSGKLNYGSSGPGSSPHLGTELFSSLVGIQMVHVPYKGAGQLVSSLLGNEVQFAFVNLLSTGSHVQAGRLRLLAHTGARRLDRMPEVPTVKESGVPYEASFWWGYMAPGKTPLMVIDRLYREIAAVAKLPEIRSILTAQGSEVVVNEPGEFARIIQADAAKWGAIGKSLGVRLD